MSFQFNIFSIVLLVSGVVAILISAWVFMRSGGMLRWFSYMMFCIAAWAITYGLELASTSLDQMLFWINLEYVGITLLPACWIVFIIFFIGKDDWLTVPNWILIFAFPFITMLLVWTNQWHHLHYQSVSLATLGEYTLLDIDTGPWYLIFTVYFYILLALGTFLLARKFRIADRIYRQQNSIIILAAFIPWIVNLLYLVGFRPYEHIDLTPYAFICTSFLLAYGLIKFRLFNVIPIAREKIIEDMRSGMLVLDSKNRIVDLNTEMRRLFNNDVSLVGKPFKELLSHEFLLHNAVVERLNTTIKLQINEHYYEVQITPLFQKNTAFSGAILLFRDTTANRLAEEKLEEQAKSLQSINQTKDKLFSVVAHDLRGPMVSLVEVMRLMEDGTISAQEFKSYMPLFSKNLYSTYALLENLLVWSRSQMKGEKLILESFNLYDLLQEKLENWETTAASKNISIHCDPSSKLMVFADREMIKIVLRNLMANALKFTSSGGKIGITAQLIDGMVKLCVNDTGTGISEENQKKLFNGTQFTTKGTSNEKGTGLGLMLCKDFVEKNGGQIWVESELGKGSKFCFTLPAEK